MRISAILASILLAAAPCFAQLPGLPPAAMPSADSSAPPTPPADVRPAERRREITIIQSGPVRGSLFKQGAMAATPIGADGQPIPGAPAAPVSFISVSAAQPRRYHKNDIITIVISEASDSSTKGTGTNNKTQSFDAALQQFIQLAVASSGLPTVETVANSAKLPEIKFKYDNKTQSDASHLRQDTVTARISGTVIDVKPNGTIVVEATKHIFIDKEDQEFKLSGVCRVEDITGDNTILSTQLASLTFSKQTSGQVHDGLKRGWLNKFIDTFSPF